MTSFFASNMALVEKRHPHLLPLLEGLQPAPIDRDQPQNFRFQGVWLHDMAQPGAECANHFSILPEEQSGVAILIGMGLGHGILRLVKERSRISHFFIFEKYPEVFLQALHQVDLTPLLSDSRVHVTLGEPENIHDALRPGFRALRLENIYSLLHPGSLQVDGEGYETLRQEIFKEINQLNVSGNTLMQHGESFFTNRMTHLPLFQRHRLLEELKFAFKGIPAILVAGGPSLNQDMDTLKKIAGHALIFGVDTVLPPLANAGILPDFVTSLDYEDITYEKFANSAKDVADQVNLITMPFICTKVPKVFPFRDIFWAFTSANMERWFNVLMGGRMENGGAGTVAHMNMIAAVSLGCSPIVLVGQDLAFTRKESSHAASVAIPDTKVMKKTLTSDDNMVVKTNDGGTAITHRAYFSFKTIFEQMIKANPGHYINATLPGAVIEGTEVMPLEEVRQTFCREKVNTQAILRERLENSSWKRDARSTENELRSTLKTIQKLKKQLKESLDEGKKALQDIENYLAAGKTYRNLDALPQKTRKHILKADNAHNQADREKIWGLIDDLTLYGLKKTDRMQLEIDRLAKTGPFLQWLAASLERLNEVARVRTHWILFFEEKLQSALAEMEGDPAYHPDKYPHPLDKIRYYHATDNLRLAREVLSELTPEDSHHPEVRLLKGKLAAIYTDYDQARQLFASLKDTPFEKEVAAFLEDWANEYAEHAEFAQHNGTASILRMLGKGLCMAPDHPRLAQLLSRFFRMDLHAIRQQEEDAESLLSDWEGWFLEYPEALHLLPAEGVSDYLEFSAAKALEENRLSEAKNLIEKAVEKQDRAQRRVRLMEICFDLEDFENGLYHLELAVAQDPAQALHWETVGDRLLANAHPETALQAYEKGLQALPDHDIFFLKIGQILLTLGQVQEARDFLEAYRQRISENPDAKNTCPLSDAENLLAGGHSEQALEVLVPLQDSHGKEARFWNLFGTACQKTGRIGDAERCFRQAIFLKPDFVEAHYHLGLLFHENGYIAEARECYENALSHDPAFFRAHINLGSIAFEQKNFPVAARHFERVMDLTPLDPNAHFNFGKSMEIMGERHKALRAFKSAMELDPHHAEAKTAHEHLLQHKTI